MQVSITTNDSVLQVVILIILSPSITFQLALIWNEWINK